MTAYAASAVYNFGTAYSGPCVLVEAVTYPIRISRVEVFANQGPTFFVLYHFSSVTASGTTFTPLALRGGAPATTANAWSNVTSSSGTKTFITLLAAASITAAGTTTINIPGGTNYTFPFDYIVPVGSAFMCLSNIGITSSSPYVPMAITVYYEELRLSWSF